MESFLAILVFEKDFTPFECKRWKRKIHEILFHVYNWIKYKIYGREREEKGIRIVS